MYLLVYGPSIWALFLFLLPLPLLYVLPPSALSFICPLISFSLLPALHLISCPYCHLFSCLSPFDGLSSVAYLLLFLLAFPYACTLFLCTYWEWFMNVRCWISSWEEMWEMHSPFYHSTQVRTLFMREAMIDNDVEQISKIPIMKWFDKSKNKCGQLQNLMETLFIMNHSES